MQVWKLYVEKFTNDNSGYELLFHDAYTLGISVETALKNNYDSIAIRPADTLEKLDYIKRLQEQHPEVEIS